VTARDVDAGPGPARETLRGRGRLRESLRDAAAVTVVTVGILVVTLQLWAADLRVPFVYGGAPDGAPFTYAGDAPFYLMVTKGLIQHGSYLRNPSLGAPFGQELYDFPQGADNLHLFALRLLGQVVPDPAWVVNVYFLLTFVAVSLAAFFVLRRFGVSRLGAGVAAILYSFLPYHFVRGTAHLFLSGYFMVPVGVLLIVTTISDRPPFVAERDGGWRLSLRGRGVLLTLFACVGLASTGAYYAILTVILLVLTVLIDFVRRRSWRSVVSAGMSVAAITLVLAFNLAPSFVYWANHGQVANVAARYPGETEINGLKITSLLLPADGHRIHALATLQQRSRKSRVPSERGQSLGVIGSLGFLGLLGLVLATALGRRRPEPPDPQLDLAGKLGVLTLIAVLCATIGGFSLIFSGFGLSEIRSWNRVSIYIAFCALAAMALLFDRFAPRLPRWRGRPVLAVLVAVAVLGVGILDQVTPAFVPNYAQSRETLHSDVAFGRRITATLGAGASVFELPYVPFPEAGATLGVGPYDEARLYLYADSLRWSFGGIHGRTADWQGRLADSPPQDIVEGLAAAGFTGIVLDRAGYKDRGGLLEYALGKDLGEDPMVSRDGRLSFFDLRAYARQQAQRLSPEQRRAVRARTLHPR
jgi:phosphoglycerol transferase